MTLDRPAAVAEWWQEHPEDTDADFASEGLLPLTVGAMRTPLIF